MFSTNTSFPDIQFFYYQILSYVFVECATQWSPSKLSRKSIIRQLWQERTEIHIFLHSLFYQNEVQFFYLKKHSIPKWIDLYMSSYICCESYYCPRGWYLVYKSYYSSILVAWGFKEISVLCECFKLPSN